MGKYGISARVSVLPLLVSDEEYKGNYLVEYPEGEGTYCFWHEDQARDWVFRVVWPVKLDDILAMLNPADQERITITELLPINHYQRW